MGGEGGLASVFSGFLRIASLEKFSAPLIRRPYKYPYRETP